MSSGEKSDVEKSGGEESCHHKRYLHLLTANSSSWSALRSWWIRTDLLKKLGVFLRLQPHSSFVVHPYSAKKFC